LATLLVTGGAGFIGGNFVRHWVDQHPADTVVIIDRLTYASNVENIKGIEQVELVVGDIRDSDLIESVLRERAIYTIVHFAAESHVDRSITGPDPFIGSNILGTNSLLKAARATWLERGSGHPHRFHHISTDEVYGSLCLEGPAFTEDSQYRPSSPYAASKASADHLVRAYNQTYGLQSTITICSNNYGRFQFPEKLIPLFVIRALHGRKLPIYGDGLNIREWLHVDDHCRGVELCLAHGVPGETYNIGGGDQLPNLTIVEAIFCIIDQMFETDPTLARRYPNAPPAKGRSTGELKTFVPDRKGHDFRYALDSSKARTCLGYRPKTKFEDGLRNTLEWYLANPNWWRGL
jgi:dTDP-glucose 4,6-dehydratase